MDVENQNDVKSIILTPVKKDEWQICCSHSSKQFIKYITTVIISLIILMFSIVMISENPNNDNSIYFSLLSSIMSLYIHPPTLENKKK
jgi:hypothetical protein